MVRVKECSFQIAGHIVDAFIEYLSSESLDMINGIEFPLIDNSFGLLLYSVSSF